jgi:hypothetical protein
VCSSDLRRINSIIGIAMAVWGVICMSIMILDRIFEPLLQTLGLTPESITLIFWGLYFAIMIIRGILARYKIGSFDKWDEFEKRFVTRIEQRRKKVSFDVPNPFKPGKLLHIKFKAKSIAEADRIAEALGIINVEDGTHELSKAAELASTISISPDLKREIFSGRLSTKEISAKCGVPAEQLGDILSGQYSKKEIMIKYAMRAEELQQIYKMLENWP